MGSLITAIILMVVGGALFMQWRKAKEAQKGTEAIVWMAASAIVSACGVISLLGAVCGGS